MYGLLTSFANSCPKTPFVLTIVTLVSSGKKDFVTRVKNVQCRLFTIKIEQSMKVRHSKRL